MSCVIVSPEQINAALCLLDFGHWSDCGLRSFYNSLHGDFLDEKLTNLGNEFMQLNEAAYYDRYDEVPSDYESFYTYERRNYKKVQSIKSLQSLIYQCEDVSDNQTNETLEKMKHLLNLYINYYISEQPDYVEAEWFL